MAEAGVASGDRSPAATSAGRSTQLQPLPAGWGASSGYPSSCFAITIRWIWLVPSYVWVLGSGGPTGCPQCAEQDEFRTQ